LRLLAQIAEGCAARQEEVAAAAYAREAGEVREPPAHGVAGDPVVVVVRPAHQGIAAVVEPAEFGVVEPGLLDELELAGDVRVDADEEQAALLLFALVCGEARELGAVGAPAAD